MTNSLLFKEKILFLFIICILVIFGHVVYAGTLPEEEPGINPYREYHSGTGDGVVDTYSGSLKVQHTDIIIPGNGGLDIQIQRSYDRDSSSFGTGLGDNSWKLHFGRLFGGTEIANQFCNSPQVQDISSRPWLELPDGTIQQFAKAPAGENYLYISKQRWIARCAGLNKGGLIIYSPNGTRYEMTEWEVRNGRSSWNVSKIIDRNGNWLSFEYTPHSTPTPTYSYTPIYLTEITSSDGRNIYFSYEDEPVSPSIKTGDKPKLLRYISENGRTWTYNYKYYYDNFNKYTHAKLEKVTLPDGKYWFYSYPSFTPKYWNTTYNGYLGEIKSPIGKKTIYNYDLIFSGLNKYELRVTSKNVYADNDFIGKWEYSYEMNGSTNAVNRGYDITTITGSDGTNKYKFITTHNTKYITGEVWKVGLPLEINRCKLSCLSSTASNDSHVESYNWSNQLVSTDRVSKSNYVYGGVSVDNGVYAPILTKKTTNSSMGTLTTQYYNHNAFGNPSTIIESGQASRTKSIEYYNNTAKWIIGVPDKETLDNTWVIDRGFDSNGNVTWLSKHGINESRSYYSTGDIWKTTDASSNTITYSNYFRGIPQRIEKPEGIVISKVVNATGTVQSETNGEGYTTHYSYDLMGRVKTITPPRGNVTYINWNAGINARDKLLVRGNHEEKTIINALGQSTEAIRRDLNNNKIIRTVFRYNAIGQKIFESYPTEDQYSLPSGSSGVSTEYDGLGNIIKITHADGKNKTFKYLTNNKVEVTDEEGKRTVYVYRSFGDSAEKELMEVNAPIASASVSIKRNALGQITDLIQNGLSVKRWAYYSGKELLSNSYEASGNYSYEYYPTGLLWKKSMGSKVSTYTYDSNARLKSIVYNDGITPSSLFTYDKNDRVKSNKNNEAVNYYDYDENGNLKADAISIDNIYLKSGYNYDANDNLNSISYPDPDNQKVDLFPDAFGRPTKIFPLADIGYHPNGNIKDLFYANNVFTLNSLDSRQRPKSSTIANTIGKTFSSTQFSYDGINNLKSISDSKNNIFNRTFEYDDIHRLTTVYGPWGSNGAWVKGGISYDSNGNIKTQVYGSYSLNYSYNNNINGFANNLLKSISGTKFYNLSYDGFGNVINNGANAFTYDMATNLRCINCASATPTNFTYGANNIRVKKNKNGISTFYLYASNGNLLTEYTPKNAEIKQYAYVGNKQIAMRRLWRMNLDLDKDGIADAKEINQVPTTNIAASENLTFYHTDAIGSPIAASSHPEGTMIWQEHYKPYGERQTRSVFANASTNWFAGKPEDTESGLSYFGARYYDPVIGRFMSVDPVEPNPNNLHSLNRYAYANNNPYKYIDPDGRYADLAIEALSIGVGIASLTNNVSNGDYGSATIDGLGIVADGALAFVPFVPGGIGLGIKGVRQSDEIVEGVAKNGSKGASGELKTVSGNTYHGNSTGSSATGGIPRAPMNQQTQQALDGVQNPSRTHGHCCEIDAINKALNAGDDVRGAAMGSVKLNESGRIIPPCSTCREVMKNLGVE